MPDFLQILIVDDDPDDRELFCEAVAQIDYTIHCSQAKNGDEALKMLENNVMLPDYIFLDLNMPRMDGRQCLKKLKTCPLLQKIPVVIYSTSKLQGDIDETAKNGAVYFITKPSKLAHLQDAIRLVLSQQWVHA